MGHARSPLGLDYHPNHSPPGFKLRPGVSALDCGSSLGFGLGTAKSGERNAAASTDLVGGWNNHPRGHCFPRDRRRHRPFF